MAARRKLTLSEKLDKIESEIMTLEEELKKLKKQKSELESKQEQEELKELRKLIHESGMSISEVMNALTK